ncbi:hypothetical protein TNCV_2540511 [Trichonephila clavipes]|nr:hypothetical protein TNCV_2540511 [Trichonephila clavipes]
MFVLHSGAGEDKVVVVITGNGLDAVDKVMGKGDKIANSARKPRTLCDQDVGILFWSIRALVLYLRGKEGSTSNMYYFSVLLAAFVEMHLISHTVHLKKADNLKDVSVSRSFESHGDSTIWLVSTPILLEDTWGWSGAFHLSSPSTNLTRELAARRLFIVAPCREGTTHLQTSTSSPGFKPSPYGTASASLTTAPNAQLNYFKKGCP